MKSSGFVIFMVSAVLVGGAIFSGLVVTIASFILGVPWLILVLVAVAAVMALLFLQARVN